ncbi:HTH-type transcriptional regulator DmlR [compost metagenome]
MNQEAFALLPAFVAVVESGSFSGAARQLGLSKSVLSKKVSQLEQALGCQLIYRTTRSLTLTEAGERYFETVRHAVRLASDGEDAIGALQSAPRGLLRVTVPMVYGRRHIAPLVPEFLALHPEVQLQLEMSDTQQDLVAEGFDVAVRIGELEDSSLVARRLAPCLSTLCAAPAYLAQAGTPRTPADLERHNCLFYSLFRGGTQWRLHGPEGEVAITPRGNFEVNNSDAIHTALLAGLGIGNMPDFIVARDLAIGRLVPVLPDHALPEHGIWCVYPKRRHLPAKVEAWLAFLQERLELR